MLIENLIQMLQSTIEYIEELKKKIESQENEKEELNNTLGNNKIEFEQKFIGLEKEKELM